MNLGDIYIWNTTRVVGHASRDKYHVLVAPGDQDNDHAFLLINSIGWEGDYEIKQAKYTFLSYDSFISCATAIRYSDAEIAAMGGGAPLGRLDKADIKGLRDALIAANSMVRQDLAHVCKGLAAGL